MVATGSRPATWPRRPTRPAAGAGAAAPAPRRRGAAGAAAPSTRLPPAARRAPPRRELRSSPTLARRPMAARPEPTSPRATRASACAPPLAGSGGTEARAREPGQRCRLQAAGRRAARASARARPLARRARRARRRRSQGSRTRRRCRRRRLRRARAHPIRDRRRLEGRLARRHRIRLRRRRDERERVRRKDAAGREHVLLRDEPGRKGPLRAPRRSPWAAGCARRELAPRTRAPTMPAPRYAGADKHPPRERGRALLMKMRAQRVLCCERAQGAGRHQRRHGQRPERDPRAARRRERPARLRRPSHSRGLPMERSRNRSSARLGGTVHADPSASH